MATPITGRTDSGDFVHYKATTTGDLPVTACNRTLTGGATASVSTSAVTLASLLPGGVIPANTVAVELQAQGGSIRMKRDGTTPTTTDGYLLYDGSEKLVDSDLTAVRFIALASGTSINIACFNRV